MQACLKTNLQFFLYTVKARGTKKVPEKVHNQKGTKNIPKRY